MSTSHTPNHSAEVLARCTEIATLWMPHDEERRVGVIVQVQAIYERLLSWGWGKVDKDELDHATVGYSRICTSYECCEWLPFDVMSDWEDNLYCILQDEERWEKYRNNGTCVSELADILRAENPITPVSESDAFDLFMADPRPYNLHALQHMFEYMLRKNSHLAEVQELSLTCPDDISEETRLDDVITALQQSPRTDEEIHAAADIMVHTFHRGQLLSYLSPEPEVQTDLSS
jgi:hypothetical protein